MSEGTSVNDQPEGMKGSQRFTSERGAEMMLKSVYAMMAGWLLVNPKEVNSPLDERTRENNRNVISVCICVTTRFFIVCPIFQCPA